MSTRRKNPPKRRRIAPSYSSSYNISMPRALKEVKCLDCWDWANTTPTAFSNIALVNAGAFYLINGIAVGSAFYQRIGAKIQMKSLQYHFYFSQSGNNAQPYTPQQCRLMIIYDKQPNGNLPTLANLLTDYSAAGAVVANPFGMINLPYRDRFEVIHDRYFSLQTANTTTGTVGTEGDNTTWNGISGYVKLRRRVTCYQTTSYQIGDISTGSLFMFTASNIASGSEPWAMYGITRLRYYDT